MLRMTTTTVAVMVGMVMVMSMVAASGTDNHPMCKVHSDGCSVPLGLPFFYKSKFTPACHIHDVCYGCGAKYGRTKEDCDIAFLQDMIHACHTARRRRSSRNKRTLCVSVATNLYYKAVHWFANPHYHTADDLDPHCHEDWVPSCLPPKYH